MYRIALYCKGTCGGGGNFMIVIALQVIQLCSALDCGSMYKIALYCKGTCGGGVNFPIVIPLQVIQLCSALPWIVAICIE